MNIYEYTKGSFNISLQQFFPLEELVMDNIFITTVSYGIILQQRASSAKNIKLPLVLHLRAVSRSETRLLI